MDAVGDVTVSPWGTCQLRLNYKLPSRCVRGRRVRQGQYALRKSKAADPGADHALGSLSEDDVEGVSTPLDVFSPLVITSGCWLLSVIMTSHVEQKRRVVWKRYLLAIRTMVGYLLLGSSAGVGVKLGHEFN